MFSADKKAFGALLLLLGFGLFWHRPALAPDFESAQKLPIAEIHPVITIVAVGDIMLSRHVGAKIEQAKNPNLPFEDVRELLDEADITFGNLECPLSDSNIPIREGLIFRCLTNDFDGVINSGFDVLSAANNHSMDQGIKGLEFTIDYLKSKNILPVGTTPSISLPHEGEMKEGVIERNGAKFGFLSYSYSAFNDGKNSTHPQIATLDIEKLKFDILNLKSRGADIIVVSMHAGTEYTRRPNQTQINFAHAAIDAGADVVIGHHPHWRQTIEVYQGKPIFYSLGNFVFDQMWSQETREGLIVRLAIRDRRLERAELIPVVIENYCCPRMANDEEKINILKKINLANDTLEFE